MRHQPSESGMNTNPPKPTNRKPGTATTSSGGNSREPGQKRGNSKTATTGGDTAADMTYCSPLPPWSRTCHSDPLFRHFLTGRPVPLLRHPWGWAKTSTTHPSHPFREGGIFPDENSPHAAVVSSHKEGTRTPRYQSSDRTKYKTASL